MPSILLVTSGIPQRGKEREGKEGGNKEEIQANVNFFALATLINLAPEGNFHLSRSHTMQYTTAITCTESFSFVSVR